MREEKKIEIGTILRTHFALTKYRVKNITPIREDGKKSKEYHLVPTEVDDQNIPQKGKFVFKPIPFSVCHYDLMKRIKYHIFSIEDGTT